MLIRPHSLDRPIVLLILSFYSIVRYQAIFLPNLFCFQDEMLQLKLASFRTMTLLGVLKPFNTIAAIVQL